MRTPIILADREERSWTMSILIKSIVSTEGTHRHRIYLSIATRNMKSRESEVFRKFARGANAAQFSVEKNCHKLI